MPASNTHPNKFAPEKYYQTRPKSNHTNTPSSNPHPTKPSTEPNGTEAQHNKLNDTKPIDRSDARC